jgi:hypothetical protein
MLSKSNDCTVGDDLMTSKRKLLIATIGALLLVSAVTVVAYRALSYDRIDIESFRGTSDSNVLSVSAAIGAGDKVLNVNTEESDTAITVTLKVRRSRSARFAVGQTVTFSVDLQRRLGDRRVVNRHGDDVPRLT